MPIPTFPLGKLPPEHLTKILTHAPVVDSRVILGPGIGLDVAVIDLGGTCLVFKSDPITFATEEIGWYVVQVNANDIATAGATPRWFLLTALLPERDTTVSLVNEIAAQIEEACQSLGVSLIGGHTEITQGLQRPVLVGTMVGEVARVDLVTPRGAMPGDRILLTKGVPVEGTAILARERPGALEGSLTAGEIEEAAHFLFDPGISVVSDAQIAVQAGAVTAMHDPTEGGLSGALWELAQACGHSLVIDPKSVPIPPLSQKICQEFRINPLETIASGALLLTVAPMAVKPICRALQGEGINCTEIGFVEAGPPRALQVTNQQPVRLPRPKRDEIARLFDS
jgi:hydrogenase maturation factor